MPSMPLRMRFVFASFMVIPLLTLVLCGVWTFGTRAAQVPAPTEDRSSKAKPQTAPSKPKLPARTDCVGDAVCARCHQDKLETYYTAHHLTSQLAKKDTIVGTFAPGSNTMATANPISHG